ncbi:MAG TPA: NAD-dependent epimerase/dehydratase family protein [Bacteroidales bacterium]|jgi:uncharacterized protein YbjT (DUF2867 family)|nr:NAD-dependent epimerase/dehydratase family protein [Bacteroidales bacterium]HOX73815.1 NAD-dependent epimerase/dehydratase family protein [Bacteroidales bacterium]HPM86678.1 NAD-dependent epimerase/dehydratase family protein [Bacteroidales bacterium]HQM68377.1 NAD-dependent epimerase/dehydratase family protein [Bacteroidales bacterium]
MKNILITGGTGLVGRHLARKLKDKGYKVSLLSRVPGKSEQKVIMAVYLLFLHFLINTE